ncbi:peptidoglycan editing factor PgeF [Vibrio tubiashii]|uniref:Purine nucleoside phosphorylase n=1 Tax=Vibrio tubiashii ATCC 19109 TaxID=1051646 RepID=F9T050_9VIBR|nr:peptidoglycan editing factor PgeF [Vibrio tubiashii]AIW13153.1 polyphenol oxidase [Vibrio tubiashii ATCC 19109]EGU58967.1 multicopper polyphenol oxidase [Vibrio tubiashii ATCC 19109]EIF05721.1 multicopper polyphenol oxidase [Vibrio tubiashii NCIMB 1337 = ATCC 19106]
MDLIVPNWPVAKQIKALASTRCDGFSTGVYQGLNLGTHVGDELAKVEQNRQWLTEQANMPSAPVWLNQTHSTVVEEVNAPTRQVLNADGVFTSTTNVVCSAMTADCLPVLLTNVQGTQVAAVHAGWRGLASGIVENAVEKFDGEVMAWIGPAIGAQVFEVGKDVVDAFVSVEAKAMAAFIPRKQEGKWLADMNQLVTQRLQRAGVNQVYYSELCTFEDAERFYSYRRDGVTGRQATFIWIEN